MVSEGAGTTRHDGTHSFEHVVERLESRKHGINVVVTVEEPRSLLESLVPELVPEDGNSNELLTDEEGLLDEGGAVVSHFVHDR